MNDAQRKDRDCMEVAIRAVGDARRCATKTREFATGCEFSDTSQWEIAFAVSELATNVLKFAREGLLILTHERGLGEQDRIVVEVIDRGPGIPKRYLPAPGNLAEGGPTTTDGPRRPGQGLGIGLGCVRRMMDSVTVETSRSGTRVVAWKFRR